MSFKKIIPTFALTAVLSVFSCSGAFFWSEFSTHVLAQNEVCFAEQHCLGDCLICEASQQALVLNKALPNKEKISSPPSPERPSTGVLVFDIPVKKVILSSFSPPDTDRITHGTPHQIVKTVVIIV